MAKEARRNLVFWTSIVTFGVSAALLLGFIFVQTYVRWAINQNFTLLGGFELEALTLLVLGQVVALAFIHRPEQ